MMGSNSYIASPLKEAIKRDDVIEYTMLLSTNPGLLDDDAVRTWPQDPMYLACEHGSFRVAEKLVEEKPEFATRKYHNGYTAMHRAAIKGYHELVLVLDVANSQLRHQMDDESMIPLHRAVIHGHIRVVEVLADEESLMKKTSTGQNSLHLALEHYKSDVSRFLIGKMEVHGQERLLSSKDDNGNSPLHIASRNKLVEDVRLLTTPRFRRAVRVKSMNKERKTPIDLLLQQGPGPAGDSASDDICRILQEAGALEPQQQAIAIEIDGGEQGSHQALNPTTVNLTGRWPLKTRDVLLTVLVMVAGGIFSSIFNLPDSILKEKYEVGAVFHVRDILSGRLPNLFYLLVVNTAAFIMSMGVTLTLVWSLPIWTVMLFLVISFFIVYFLIVSNTTPKFSVRVGSRNITSKWLMWLLVGEILFIVALAKWSSFFLLKLVNWFKEKLTLLLG